MYEKLYEENKGLLRMMARRYARVCALDRAVSVEDLMQAGFVGLMRAAATFDPEAGKSWAGWARWHIRMEFESALGLRHGRFRRRRHDACHARPPRRLPENLRRRGRLGILHAAGVPEEDRRPRLLRLLRLRHQPAPRQGHQDEHGDEHALLVAFRQYAVHTGGYLGRHHVLRGQNTEQSGGLCHKQ